MIRLSRNTLGASIVAALSLSAASAVAEPCALSSDGAPMATGKGNASPRFKTDGQKRLGAEQAAFMTALVGLRSCLGERAAEVTGWKLGEVRYFDADPLVEVDVVALFDGAPQAVVLGSAVPGAGSDIKAVRLNTTRAARVNAQRAAKAALDALLPASGKTGEASQRIAGSLGGCELQDIAYWDDQAVSVQLSCGKAPAAPPEPHPAPAVIKR